MLHHLTPGVDVELRERLERLERCDRPELIEADMAVIRRQLDKAALKCASVSRAWLADSQPAPAATAA